jgi:hypothetical protein
VCFGAQTMAPKVTVRLKRANPVAESWFGSSGVYLTDYSVRAERIFNRISVCEGRVMRNIILVKHLDYQLHARLMPPMFPA